MSQLDLELMPRLTVYGAIVQSARMSKANMVYIPDSSLNEKYNVFRDETPDLSKIPDLDYFTLGRGSTYEFVESDGSKTNKSHVHDPLDASLFYPTPFVLRRQGEDDLDPARRAKYALRALIQHEGVTYVAYFLKKVDRSATTLTAEIVVPPATPADTETRNPIAGDEKHLNPTPKIPSPATSRDDGAYVAVTTKVGLSMDTWEVQEAINAKQILTGTSQLEITEVGLVSAVQDTKSATDGASTFNYVEALKAQINLIAPHRFMLNDYVSTPLNINMNLGVNNPTNFAFLFS